MPHLALRCSLIGGSSQELQRGVGMDWPRDNGALLRDFLFRRRCDPGSEPFHDRRQGGLRPGWSSSNREESASIAAHDVDDRQPESANSSTSNAVETAIRAD